MCLMHTKSAIQSAQLTNHVRDVFIFRTHVQAVADGLPTLDGKKFAQEGNPRNEKEIVWS